MSFSECSKKITEESSKCCRELRVYLHCERRIPRRVNSKNKWRQTLPIGDDLSGYSLQIIDNEIAKNGEPRDWKLTTDDFLSGAISNLEESQNTIEKLDAVAAASKDKFLGVIGSYIEMLNQVGLFATLVIGFGMAPITGMMVDPLAVRHVEYLILPFVWSSLFTVFASGWCVLESIFLSIKLNVISSSLITGMSSRNKHSINTRNLGGINSTWNGIMFWFFISIITFILQSTLQFVLGMHVKKKNHSHMNMTSNDLLAEYIKIQTYDEEKAWASFNPIISSDGDITHFSIFEGAYGTTILSIVVLTSIFSFVLLVRCSTTYVQYTSSISMKIFTAILCYIPRCFICYWPSSTEYKEPLERLNFEYEFALKNLQFTIEEVQHETRQFFNSIKAFTENPNKLKTKLVLNKIRNLESFILQIQEGRNKMKIRNGEYSDSDINKESSLDNVIFRRRGVYVVGAHKYKQNDENFHTSTRLDF
jgi:hypothetical protein